MREFFHGWRRKCGAVTLVMACFTTMIWLRSSITQEVILISVNSKTQYEIVSFSGGVCWQKSTIINNEGSFKREFRVSSYKLFSPFVGDEAWKNDVVLWRKQNLGFELGQFKWRMPSGIGHPQPQFLVSVCIFPWWALVTLPTPLSAFLLLTKPRPPKRAAANNPPGDATA